MGGGWCMEVVVNGWRVVHGGGGEWVEGGAWWWW